MSSILCAGHNFHVHGGSDRYMMELIDLLSAKGDSVIPFAVQSEKNIPSEYSEYFPIATDTSSKSIGSFARYCYSRPAKLSMERLLNDHQIELAHLHIYYGQLTSSILRPLADRNIPIVQTLHEYKLSCPAYTHLSNGLICEQCRGKNFINAIKNKCKDNSYLKSALIATESTISRKVGDIDLIDHFIAPSKFMKNQMIKNKTVAPERISVIPYHIDANKFSPSSADGEHILYFGRLSAVKGLRTLLNSAKHAPFKLLIVGEGPLRTELEDIVRDEKLDNVTLLGFQSGDTLRQLIATSVCTVLPSEWFDNFPLAIMESMAQARPVVGASIGGIPEMIRHNKDGLLFESGNSEQLSEALIKLWDDRELALEMGRAGREKMIQLYNPEDHYEKIKSLYGRLIN